jgi:hypothetical protein
MAARAGIEPELRFLEAFIQTMKSETGKTADAQLRAQELSSLTKIILTWPNLSVEFRTAMQVMTQGASKRQ